MSVKPGGLDLAGSLTILPPVFSEHVRLLEILCAFMGMIKLLNSPPNHTFYTPIASYSSIIPTDEVLLLMILCSYAYIYTNIQTYMHVITQGTVP